MGVDNDYRLLEYLIKALHLKNIFTLSYAHAQVPQLRGRLGWWSSLSLGLVNDEASEWDHYVRLLVSNYIILQDEEPNKLYLSKNPKSGEFTTKLGYKTWIESLFTKEKKWWWRPVWKIHAPLKNKIMLWLALSNKIITWEVDRNRGWVGRSMCIIKISWWKCISLIYWLCICRASSRICFKWTKAFFPVEESQLRRLLKGLVTQQSNQKVRRYA